MKEIVILMDARILNYSSGLDPNMMMNPCEGTTLHANLYPGGRVNFEKESIHTTGYCDDGKEKPNVTNNLMIRWIGVKGVFYSDENDNVKMEIWLDKEDTNRWGDKPVCDYTD